MSRKSRKKKVETAQDVEARTARSLDEVADDLDALLAKGDPAAMALVGRCGIGPRTVGEMGSTIIAPGEN